MSENETGPVVPAPRSGITPIIPQTPEQSIARDQAAGIECPARRAPGEPTDTTGIEGT